MNYLKKMGLTLLLVSGLLRATHAQDVLTVTPQQPSAGKDIQFTLQPHIQGEEYTAQIVVFHPSGYNADDVDLDGLSGTFRLPDNATAFLINYTVVDSERKSGIASAIYADGQPVQGSYYAHYMLYDGLGAHFSDIESDQEKSLAYLEQEFDNYPESKEKWLSTYLRKLPEGEQKEQAREMVNARVAAAFDNPASTERELREPFVLLGAFDESDVMDSLSNLIVERYPNGVTERLALFGNFRSESDYARKTEIYQQMMDVQANIPSSTLQFMHGEMAKAAFANGDTEKLESYIAAITNLSSRASTLNSIAWPLAEKGEELELAEKLSKQSVDIIEAALANAQESKPASVTLSQWRRQLAEYSLPSYMDTYALIRYKQGALDDALAYQQRAVGEYRDADAIERLIQYLQESGMLEEALEVGKHAISKGKANAQAKTYLQNIYLTTGKTEQEFAEYYAGLEAVYLQNLREELASQLLDEEAPEFELKNLAGSSVTSESMLGKVYVVDFWATWCGPCLASFPAMQTAVNQYADREDVEFLFVNTWENIPNREDAVAKFIEDNEYSFHVLFDTVDENRQFDIVSAYKVSGIPTKFVVDKQGKIRFKAVGFGGSAEEEVHKLNVMIDLASNPPSIPTAGE